VAKGLSQKICFLCFKANFIIFSGELFSNEFVIYENWINGRNYQINNKNLIKILGSHSLFIGEKEIDSILFKIDENELVGTLSRDTVKKQLINNVEFVGERISFSQNNNFFSVQGVRRYEFASTGRPDCCPARRIRGNYGKRSGNTGHSQGKTTTR